MKITYLGSGSLEGIPSLFCRCNVCEAARQSGGQSIKTRSCTRIDNVLIDLSPDIFTQTIHSHSSLTEIRNIVFTHSHPDHLNTFEIINGLGKYSAKYPDSYPPLNIFGNAAVERKIMHECEMASAVISSRLIFHEIHEGDKFTVDDLKFTAFKANHKLDEESLIFVIQSKGKAIFYGNDTGAIFPQSLQELKKENIIFDVVSMDTSRGTLPGDTHMGLRENIEFKNWLAVNGLVHDRTQYYLNHYSHMCGMTVADYSSLVSKYGFQLTYDGMTIEV